MGRKPNKFRPVCLEPEAPASPPQTDAGPPAAEGPDQPPAQRPGRARRAQEALGSLIRPGRPRSRSKRKQQALDKLQAQQRAAAAGGAHSVPRLRAGVAGSLTGELLCCRPGPGAARAQPAGQQLADAEAEAGLRQETVPAEAAPGGRRRGAWRARARPAAGRRRR